MRLLGDDESYYRKRDGTLLGPSPVGGCAAAAPATPRLPDTIGYGKVTFCDCQGTAATQFAESIQRAIRAADRSGLAGWIVYNDREYAREYHNGAAISFGETFASVPDSYTLAAERPRVAVLTDGVVASSGEAIVVFFKGRPDTRSFGTATCGHHHLQEQFSFSDGGALFLVSGQHADRTKRRYGGRIAPDETIADPAEAVSRAVAWLQSGR